MIYSPRNNNNETLCEIKVWEKMGQVDINFSLDVEKYSNLLLSIYEKDKEMAEDFIRRIDFLAEQRDLFFSFPLENNDFTSVDKAIGRLMKSTAENFNFYLIED